MESLEGFETSCGDLGARRAERQASTPGREGGFTKLAIRFFVPRIWFRPDRDYETRNELLRFAFLVFLSIAVVFFFDDFVPEHVEIYEIKVRGSVLCSHHV